MPCAQWSLQLGMVRPPHVYKTSFGPVDGVPLSGDFNGDGLNEMAVFADGRWFVDFNGNSQWDAADLCIALGAAGDHPVIGDWNGDGKDDIGVVRRPAAQRRDVILAGAEQPVRSRKGGEYSFGPAHGTPVVGDWTNTGIDRIGVFHEGIWTLDVDGDRRFTQADSVVRLGNQGDAPIVGDFNRDGRDDLGVYRHGTWQIDTTGDLRLGPDDLTYQLGDDDDTPVVGDWDGDGRDQIGVVHRAARGSRPPSAG
ncbi:MAG: VCBS repeat-containing protein [Pirellulales bacterium]